MGIIVGTLSFILFLLFQTVGIFTGDSGDLVTAAVVHGVPHPPGYPLYTFLGFLFSQLPLFTLSWRVTLLSSLPHAITVATVFLIVYRVTKSRLAGVFAALVLVGNYLFFLYSVTPEVFALFDMFFMILLYELIQYQKTRSLRLLFGIAFTFGLALTHHHLILFAVPALLYGVISIGLSKKFGIKDVGVLLLFFILGLLPYVYAPMAGATNAIINWDKPTTVARFIQLISRQDYGSFVSGGVIGHSLMERFISIKAYVSFIFLDFRVVGIALAFLGLWRLWMRERILSHTLLLLLFLFGPFFFFYASFPIVSRFTLGTYERFLLPSYCIYAILLGLGLHEALLWVTTFVNKRGAGSSLVRIVFCIILFIYPLTVLSVTLYRFMGIRTDKTAENLGRDVLLSVPENAILLLSQDTTLFTTQYVRYGLNMRPDTIVLHASRMTSTDYQEVVKHRFPMLLFPASNSQSFLGDFVQMNQKEHRIFANAIVGVGSGWYFMPHGLLYEVVAEDGLLPIRTLQRENIALFDSYSNPLGGILKRYKHLMLSDVLDVYAWAHINYGKTLVKATLYEDAAVQFQEAVLLDGDSTKPDAYMYLGVTQAVLGRCQEALASLDVAKKSSMSIKPEYLLYESLTYRDCVKDASRAAILFSEYEKLNTKAEVLLQSL